MVVSGILYRIFAEGGGEEVCAQTMPTHNRTKVWTYVSDLQRESPMHHLGVMCIMGVYGNVRFP